MRTRRRRGRGRAAAVVQPPLKPGPFLRWAGGKRWLARYLGPLLKSRLLPGARYHEPFLGSGSMFFAVAPERALLSDLNSDLITTFRVLATHHRDIRDRLRQLRPSAQTYYRVRSSHPRSLLGRVVRFIYLNRNSFGGLYRENKLGVFNVPYGGGARDHLSLCANGALARAGQLLNNPAIEVTCLDYAYSLRGAGRGDVVYCDPAYRAVTREQFDRYGKTIFDWHDQDLLARLARRAYHRGALVVLSNTTCRSLRGLYPDAIVIALRRPPGIGRGNRTEHLFVLDPLHQYPMWRALRRRITTGE